MNPTFAHGSRIRAVAALGALALILLGIPWALLTLAGPATSGLPGSVDAALALLRRPDDGTLFVGFLVGVAWLAWAAFALCVLLEVLAQLRNRPTWRLPGLGWLQLAAAGLVSSVVVGLSGNVALAQAHPASPAVVVTNTSTDTVVAPAGETPAPTASTTQEPGEGEAATTTYTTQRHDTYLSIAEHHLGDRERYSEIIDLNTGRQMPDGTVLTGEEFLTEGWELLLPATPTASEETREVEESLEVEVEPGDTLSHLALDHLGDADAYPAIVEANTDRTQPDGQRLTDPDLIHPGWILTIPTDETTPEEPPSTSPEEPEPSPAPAPSSPSPSAGPEDAPPDEDAPEPTPSQETPDSGEDEPTPTSEAPSDSPQAGDSDTPTTTEAPDPEHTQEADTEEVEEEDEAAIPAAALIGYSALLATGLLTVLATRRLIQHRRRHPGHRIAQPEDENLLDAEQRMRQAADPASVELLDQGLRSLAAHAGGIGQELPHLLGARVSDHTCILDFAEPPARVLAPFQPIAERRWVLDRDDEALLPAYQARATPAPYPSLVTLGRTESDEHLLLDLVEIGALNLTGEPTDIEEVLRALALELATAPWCDHLNVTLAGFGAELPPLIKTQRLRHAPTLLGCLKELELLARDLPAPPEAEESPTPEIILCAHPIDPQALQRLRELTQAAPHLPLAIVTAATEQQHLPTEWSLPTAPNTPVEVLGRPLTLQRLSSEEYTHIQHLLRTAAETTSTPAPEWKAVPPEPTTEEEARSHTTPMPPPPEAAPSTETTPTDDAVVQPAPSPSPDPPLEPPPAPDPTTDNAGSGATPASSPSPAKGTPLGAETAAPAVHGEPPQPHPEPPTTLPTLADPTAPRVRILGPVDITGADASQLEAGKRRTLIELACLLRLKPGQSREQISQTMGGPRGPWSASTRSANLSRLRSWLGRAPDGQPYLPHLTDNAYRLTDAVGCDWHDFQTLAHHGLAHDTAEGIAALHQALALVRGAPFAGTPPDRYHWAEPLKPTISAAIADVAHTIAMRHLATADPDPAREALIQILDIDPANELLYRDLIRLEHQAHNPEAIDRAIQRLTIALDRLDLEMEPETIHLLEQLHKRR